MHVSHSPSAPLSPTKVLRQNTSNEAHLYLNDALTVLGTLKSNSIHFVCKDPPFYLEHMDEHWAVRHLPKAVGTSVVKNLPPGMKFDPAQGVLLQAFMAPIFVELIRVMKPGGYGCVFSSPRLYHHMAVAAEAAGFEIRDMFFWKRNGQAKAFKQDHFVKQRGLSPEEESEIIGSMGGRRTPQLRPMVEPILFIQKPKEVTFVDNWMKHGVGLVDTTQSLDDKFPGTLMEVSKPTKRERGPGNEHPTVKPVTLISHLIKLFSTEGQVVLDPFMGSGSHGAAAALTNRRFVGIETDPAYFDLAVQRITQPPTPLRAGAGGGRRKHLRVEDTKFRHAPFNRDWTDEGSIKRFAA